MVGVTGDISVASGPLLGQQRVLRRLLTNPGEYIWQLDYGAGLARFIGQPVNPSQITAVIRSEIFKETVGSDRDRSDRDMNARLLDDRGVRGPQQRSVGGTVAKTSGH